MILFDMSGDRHMSIRMNNSQGTLVLVTALLACSGTASAQRAGQSMSIQTGWVVGAEAVNLQSQAGRGAAVGGMVGLAATSRNRGSSRRMRNTMIGAATGAAIAGGAQGNLNGMQYTIEVGAGSRIVVVTDQTEVRIGDCVNVEQAGSGTANVRRVSTYLCEAAANDAIDEDLQTQLGAAADLCLAAKERLLDAETEAEVEAAIARVHILCDD